MWLVQHFRKDPVTAVLQHLVRAVKDESPQIKGTVSQDSVCRALFKTSTIPSK